MLMIIEKTIVPAMVALVSAFDFTAKMVLMDSPFIEFTGFETVWNLACYFTGMSILTVMDLRIMSHVQITIILTVLKTTPFPANMADSFAYMFLFMTGKVFTDC